MKHQIIENKGKIIEKSNLQILVGKEIGQIVMSGTKLEGHENGFNSYAHLFLLYLKERAFVLNIFYDGLILGDSVITVEAEDTQYVTQMVYEPVIKHYFETPFILQYIEVYGQKGSFHFEGKEIHPLWFRGESVPDNLDYIVDSENALMLISTDGRRIFLAHDTSPRFEIATSEAHIDFILSHKYGFEEGYFQLKRTISA